MNSLFRFDERLGISVPDLSLEWTQYSIADRSAVLERWEKERGDIMTRISVFEEEIAQLQEQLSEADDWDETVAIMGRMNDYASRIADLNILFRTQPDLEPSEHDEPPESERD